MEGRSDASCVVVIVTVFASLVVCAIFISVAGGDFEMHMFALLTGKEERFRWTRGWF
jgi:hypothetical protein